jgi:PEP-CTERM motif
MCTVSLIRIRLLRALIARQPNDRKARLRMPKSALFVLLLAVLALPAGATMVIKTFPTWNHTDTIFPFGYPNTATYGEAITTPAGQTDVTRFSFWLEEPVGFQFQAFIAPWDNNNYLIPGGLAGVSFLSPVKKSNNASLKEYTVDVPNLTVTPGTIYMFGVTIDNVYNKNSGFTAGSMGGDYAFNGNSTYYLAFNNDSGNGTLLGQNWNTNNNGCADNGGTCGQAAFSVTYHVGPVPEPGSFLLLCTGLVGLAGAVRRKLSI